MLQEITSLHTETLVLFIALTLALVNALVSALRTESWAKRGKMAMRMQDYKSAVHYFSQNILNHPDDPNAYKSRAEAYMQSGETQKAQEDQRTANRLITEGDHTLSPSF